MPGFAQSELSFPRVASSDSVFSVTNPSDAIVEVEFALFGLDGALLPAAANPVRYEIPSRGTFSMSVADVFATSVIGEEGAWVRISSTATGVSGVLFDPASGSNLEVVSQAPALEDQLVLIPDGGFEASRELRVVNPSGSTATINVTVFSLGGVPIANTSAVLPEDAAAVIDVAAMTGSVSGLLTVRVNANVGVAAQVSVTSGGSAMLLNGQPATSGAVSLRVAPHVAIGNGFTSTLALSNPTGQAVTVTVTLRSETGGPLLASQSAPPQTTVSIPSNGSVALDAVQLTGLVFPPTVNGWLQVDSPGIPLAASLIVRQSAGASAYPLQTSSTRRTYYPRQVNEDGQFSSLSLTNLELADAEVGLVIVDLDGDTVSRASLVVAGNSKRNVLISDLFPASTLTDDGWLGIESSTGIYSTVTVGESSGAYIAAVEPQILPAAFEFNDTTGRPVLVSISPLETLPGERLVIRTSSADVGTTLIFGDVVVEPAVFANALSILLVDVPQVATGFVEVRVRSATGEESEPVTLLVRPAGEVPLREVRGRAFYEKVVSTSEGLNLDRPVAVPIRGARVEVFDELTGVLFAVAATDDAGNYRIPVPEGEGYTVRILSTSTAGVTVADNTSNGALYPIGTLLGAQQPAPLVATDESRLSGAFNILEVMRQGNRVLARVEPDLPVQGLTIYWSPLNSRDVGDSASGAIGGTFFDAASNTAFILGDRLGDSDEFDDAVILHEYAHMLAALFSSDDSAGGPHFVGDVLDPRVAWSEGWANFFSSFVRRDPVYRDTFGEGGSLAMEYNLDENFVPGDPGGYWSEFSIHSLLWDLVDADGDEGDDTLTIGFERIWQAFRGMSSAAFVYAPTFLDALVALEPLEVSAIEQLARSRTIDYLASADPTVSNPFPRIIAGNVPVTGEVDSLTRRRANLAQSAHLYALDVDGGAVSIRLDVIGLGPGNSPHANDLDLFLLDSSGRALARSDRGLNGQSELISTFLPSGRYIVEVRSYYTRASTGTLVYNSGAYRLKILTP